jgi:signal transduction histidine kinase
LEETLKLANRRKDEFLALLAHELRNPLAPIRNGVEIMRLLGPGNPQIIRDTGELIARQVTHLARLVDDLLDVSRVTQGKVLIKEEPVELASAINNGIELAQPLIDAKRHKLSISLPTTEALRVRGDPTRLAQIVGNLLDNAAKYTNADGRIPSVLCARVMRR